MNPWCKIDINLDTKFQKIIGGKGLGLWQLLKQKLPIPTTYVLTTDYFQNYLFDPQQLPSYTKLLALAITCDQEAISRCSLDLRNEIDNLNIILPNELEHIYLTRLNQHSWALRSSMSIEDGLKNAYAGIFESCLHLDSLEQLKDKIKEIFAQAFSERAIFYTLEQGIPLQALLPALLIQEQIAVDWSGTYFTCNPLPKGNYQQGVISFKKGYGDTLMSGSESGHSVFVNEGKIELSKEFMHLTKPLQQLINSGLKLQRNFNLALDLEWGIKNGHLIFFQMRPIPNIDFSCALNPIRWSRMLTEERYPEAISPLGWSILYSVFQVNLDTLKKRFGLQATSTNEVAKVINDYVYANDSFFKFPDNIKTNYWHQLKYIPFLMKALIKSCMALPLLWISNFFSSSHKISSKLFLLMGLFSGYIFRHAKDIIKRWDQELPKYIQDFDEAYQHTIDIQDKKKTYQYRDRLEKIAILYMGPDLAIYVIKTACVWMVNTMSKALFPNEPADFLLLQFSKSLEKNRTLEMNIQFKKLFQTIKQDSNLLNLLQTNQLQEALTLLKEKAYFLDFLQKNGHLTSNWDIREPTWEEDPIRLMPFIRTSVMNSESALEESMQSRLKEHNQFCEQLFASLRLNPVAMTFLKNLNHFIREFMRIDEEHHFYCSRVFKATRAFYHEIAHRLVAENKIKEIDEIYFLTEEEIKEVFQNEKPIALHFMARKRKKQFQTNLNQIPVSSYLGDYIEQENINATFTKHANGTLFCGESGSPGLVKGKVKIIKSIEDAKKINLGDIIVTQSPNPVFTPLYSLATGLVTSTGSILSHGIVSAREYQIPAVLCIPGIDKLLNDDQIITVNGNTGQVYVEGGT
ncbi:PEP/pyruvate-binding domain-containing protein [Legionella sp. D16C41]|uniref:PEP/pyruvate-binding domain-containing protein n=1 Tax=Legionella sp. D16C41 TaxID=3402688 RepID=UPI003AF7AA60